MIITEITYPNGEKAIQIQPENGYKYVTNGRVWGELVTLGKTDSVENWHDTNEEPPEDDLK